MTAKSETAYQRHFYSFQSSPTPILPDGFSPISAGKNPYSERNPALTHGSALKRGIEDVLKDATPGMIASWLNQTALLELGQWMDHSIDPNVSELNMLELGKNLLKASPFSWGNREFLANIGVNVADAGGFLVGGWIGEKAIQAKMKTEVDRQPKNPLILQLWKMSIMTQFASLGIAGVKTLTHMDAIINDALKQINTHPEFALGGLFATFGGVLSIADNILPKKDTSISKKELIIPSSGMALSIIGFILCPPELKSAAAGYTVAAIANFCEKITEQNRHGGKK